MANYISNCPHVKEVQKLMLNKAYRHARFQKIVDMCVNQPEIPGEDSRSDPKGGDETSRRLAVLTSEVVAETPKGIGEWHSDFVQKNVGPGETSNHLTSD